MAFTLKCPKGGEVVFQPLPSEVTFSNNTMYHSFKIMSKGSVDVPSGVEVREISFEGEFFGEKLAGSGGIDPTTWQDPIEVRNMLNMWQREKKILVLNLGDIKYKNDVSIASLQMTNHGAFGNVKYSITFKVDRDITVKIEKKKKKKKGGNGGGKIKPRKKKPETKNIKFPLTHEIKKDDTFWKLASKYYGDGKKWTKIKNKNQDKIDKWMAKHMGFGLTKVVVLGDMAGMKIIIPAP